MGRVVAIAAIVTAAACGGASVDGATYVWDDGAQALVQVDVGTPATPATPSASNPPPDPASPASPAAPAPASPGGTKADSSPDPVPARPVDPFRRCDGFTDPFEKDACRKSAPRPIR